MLWGLFLIYPLIAFFIAIKKFNYKNYRIIIILFLGLYGYTFLPIPESDGDQYKNEYINLDSYSFNDYLYDIALIYDGESINPDIYLETVRYFTFLISENYQFFFFIVAIIYFFIAIKLIGAIYDDIKQIALKFDIVYLIGLCTLFNISFGVNGIRFPLAFWVFSYGAFFFIRTDKKWYLLIALSSIFIHFSFMYCVIFLILYTVLKPLNIKPFYLYMLLILGVVFSELFPELVSSYINLLDGSYSNKVEAYTSENYIESREQHVKKWNWYIQVNQVATYYFCIVSIIITKLKIFRLKFNKLSNSLFTFSMFMLLSTVISGTLIDSISNRYYLVFTFFTLLYLLYLSIINYRHNLLFFLRFLYVPILVLHVLVILRGDLYTINSSLIFGNSLSIFLFDSDVSIYELLFK